MSLKVFDLQCQHGHVFEGWFGSLDNYDSQQARGLIACPICDNRQIIKKISAPRINVNHGRGPDSCAAPAQGKATAVAAPASGQLAQLQAELMRHIRQIVRDTDDVGAEFAYEARRMHYGDAEERAIRGTATEQERESLAQEGIAVMPIPDFLDEDRLQ
ncbi:MAG: DUF1178 family protein [Burkholderiaceae bacterium]